MLIGILSDSHGDVKATARAVSLLIERGATKLIHCGDICGEAVLDELAGQDAVFVWGNCDSPSAVMRRYVTAIGLPIPDGPLTLEWAGRRIGVFHGHEPEFEFAIEEGAFDYIFYGHTHKYADRRVRGCRLINPGALHRARVKTVCLLDVEKDEAMFLDLVSNRPVRVVHE